MSEPVEWLLDGTPRSPRFDDIYRSSTGGLEQASHVFLRGCGLPGAWAGHRQWRILETGFGLGMNFLAAWRAWLDDPRRPGLLHFASVEAWPVGAADLVRSAESHPELVPLAQELAGRWRGLTPGTHRLAFEQGRVLLTLYVGDVRDAMRQQPFNANSIFLDGFEPRRNAAMWELQVFKAVARHATRGTRVATWTVASEVRRDLAQCGFSVEKVPGLAPKRDSLSGVFSPAWEPKGQRPAQEPLPGQCVVIGAGLAGAAVAASLARRGWQVTVLDAADAPAAGASGLPAGLLAPHHSPDDNLLSRLSRCGVRMTLQEARALLAEGAEWQATGVLEHRLESQPPLAAVTEAAAPWTRDATAERAADAGLDGHAGCLWHELGGWINPGALVRAWLGQPGIHWQGGATVESLVRGDDRWRVIYAGGIAVAEADLVVVAAAHASAALLGGRLLLQPVRGQVSWGVTKDAGALPAFAVNGNGHFVPGTARAGGRDWFCGSTFNRGETDLEVRESDHRFNLDRLEALLPRVAQQLAPAFADGSVKAWTGVRCASIDRRPLLGEMAPGLWVSTAMGSRGLTFAALCAELLAARLHGEPLPLDRRLAMALDARRRGATEAPPGRAPQPARKSR